MPNKLITSDQLQLYKTLADTKYQDKLAAGRNITISGNVISAKPRYVTVKSTGTTKIGGDGSISGFLSFTLQPGIYYVVFTCRFVAKDGGYRRCGIGTSKRTWNNRWQDTRQYYSGRYVQPRTTAIIQVLESEHPNGQTFYLQASQTSGTSLSIAPRCYYIKF